MMVTTKARNMEDFDELKHEPGFLQYLKDSGMSNLSYPTMCRWVQRNGMVKLDREYESDRCESVCARLSNRDGEFSKFVGSVKPDADVARNLGSYRSAVLKYVEFMDAVKYGDGSYANLDAHRRTHRRRSKSSAVKVSYLPGFGPGGKASASESEAALEPAGMDEIAGLWREYMGVTNRITAAIGRSSNIVGEFAERLVAEYYRGKLLTASNKSADVELPDGRLVQVKSRVPRQTMATSLSPIRSWNFDLLIVVLFDTNGSVLKALEYGAEAAKAHARRDEHQNCNLIVTTDEFLRDPQARDVTSGLNSLIERR